MVPPGSAWQNFYGDMSLALGAIRRGLTITVLTALAVAGSAALFVFGHGQGAAAATLVLFGAWVVFGGVQRWWLSELLAGRRVATGEFPPIFRSMLWRFLILALWVATPAVIAVVTYVVVYFVQHPHVLNERSPKVPNPSTAFVITLSVGTAVIVDILLTFVMPALALSTRSVRNAMQLGIRMIAQTWPTSAWYVLAPGVTLLAALCYVPIPDIACTILLAAAGVLSLWIKGATVGFYQRSFRGSTTATTKDLPPSP